MGLILRRGDGERLEDGRWVWGAEIAGQVNQTIIEALIIVPPEMMVLLQRQIDAPRNAGASVEDLVERAAGKAARRLRGQTELLLSNADLDF